MRTTIFLAFVRNAILLVWLPLFSTMVRGATNAPVSLKELQQQADIIVGATVNSISNTGTVTLEVATVLKGTGLSSTLVTAKLPAMIPPPEAMVGVSGIWFLTSTNGSYTLLAGTANPLVWRDLYLPAEKIVFTPPANMNLDYYLLHLLVAAYKVLPRPTLSDDIRTYTNLIRSDRDNGFQAAQELILSLEQRKHLIGLAAAIHFGSEAHVRSLIGEARNLQSEKLFFLIKDSIRSFQPSNPSGIALLSSLISTDDDVPGLSDAAGAALQRLGTKAVVPAIAILLDSKDTKAQLRGAAFLSYFSLFVDAQGNFPGTGVIGPFSTADTKQFTPRKDAAITPPQYAGFWKLWWSQNWRKLGFPTP